MKVTDDKIWRWLIGEGEWPLKDYDEVPLPDSITVCWECGKITEGYNLCDKCTIKVDAQIAEMREDNED